MAAVVGAPVQVTIAMCSSSRVVQVRRFRTLFCSRAKKDSMAALSPAAPTRRIELTIPWRFSAPMCLRLRNCDPRSVCTMHPATSPRPATTLFNAFTAMRDFIRESIEYQTILFENTSLIART